MSRFSGNAESCTGCGITYGAFRTGLDFKTIREWYWSGSAEPSDWKYKRRGTVLGRWHMEKQQLWALHKHECSQESQIAQQGCVG